MESNFFIISILLFLDTYMIITKIMHKKVTLCRLLIFATILIATSSISLFIDYDKFISAFPLFLLSNIVIMLFLFNKVKVFSVIYVYSLLLLTNTLLSACVVLLSPYGKSFALYTDLIANVLVIFICFICCYFEKIKIKATQLYLYVPKAAKIIILCILGIFDFFTALLMNSNFHNDLTRWHNFIKNTTLYVILTVLVMVIYLLYTTITNTRLKQLTDNYEQQINIQAEHYKNLADSYVDVRRFRHDFKNMSIAIEKLLDNGNNEEAISLLKRSVNSIEHGDKEASPFKSGNPIADALLADKQKRARLVGATIEFDGFIPAEQLSPTDICVLLGNTLDNAIEACEKFSDDVMKKIRVSANCVGSAAFINVENPIIEKVNIKDNHIKTTKDNKTLHGFGLYSLHSIIKKYAGTLELSSTDHSFSVEMSLFFNN